MAKEIQTLKSKGAMAFAVYFIVFSIALFIKSLAKIIYYLTVPTDNIQNNPFGAILNKYAAPTSLDWIIHSFGVILSFLLFFAALFIIRNKRVAISTLTFSSIGFIFVNILQITQNLINIKSATGIYSYTSYATSMWISFDVVASLFWIFVMWFFHRQNIKNSLTD